MIGEFKDSETQNVSQTLLIAIAGATGSGKTESMLRLARGIVGPQGEFAVIDTENKRALNKKARHRFKHLDLQPPYTPEHYQEAIEAAIKAGFKAVVVDSFTHEWDGEGGLSDDAAETLERMSKGDPARAEKLTALAWKQPKQRHKKLMNYLRRCDVPIIFGLRAEPKIKFTKDHHGKMQVIDAGWLPITEKMFGYDMLIYALLMPDNPGVPVHLKKLEPEFEPIMVHGKQISEDAGRLLAQWASPHRSPEATSPTGSGPPTASASWAPTISADQHIDLTDRLREALISQERACKAWKVESVAKLPSDAYSRALEWIAKAMGAK